MVMRYYRRKTPVSAIPPSISSEGRNVQLSKECIGLTEQFVFTVRQDWCYTHRTFSTVSRLMWYIFHPWPYFVQAERGEWMGRRNKSLSLMLNEATCRYYMLHSTAHLNSLQVLWASSNLWPELPFFFFFWKQKNDSTNCFVTRRQFCFLAYSGIYLKSQDVQHFGMVQSPSTPAWHLH